MVAGLASGAVASTIGGPQQPDKEQNQGCTDEKIHHHRGQRVRPILELFPLLVEGKWVCRMLNFVVRILQQGKRFIQLAVDTDPDIDSQKRAHHQAVGVDIAENQRNAIEFKMRDDVLGLLPTVD